MLSILLSACLCVIRRWLEAEIEWVLKASCLGEIDSLFKCSIVAELLWIQRSWGIVRYPIVSKVFIFVSIVFGGPGRQQFRQKGEPSEFRQFFNWKLKNLICTPKWPPWSNYNFCLLFQFRQKCQNSEKVIQTNLGGFFINILFWPKITTFLKIKLLVPTFFLGVFVRQSVRIQTNCQTGSECNSDNCLADPLSWSPSNHLTTILCGRRPLFCSACGRQEWEKEGSSAVVCSCPHNPRASTAIMITARIPAE